MMKNDDMIELLADFEMIDGQDGKNIYLANA